jgi:hypothetical protein
MDCAVNALRTTDNPNAMLHTGCLNDLLEPDRAIDKPKVLNILDIRMGGAPIATPPQYR